MSRASWLRAAAWLVAVGLVAWTLSRVSIFDALSAARALSGSEIAVLFAVNVAAIYVYALRWWVVLRGLGAAPGFGRLALYRMAAFGFAYFTPGPQVGGEPVQVLLLERRHDVSRQTAIASVALDRLLDGIVNQGLLVAAAVFLATGRAAWLLAALVAGLFAYLFALVARRAPLGALFRRDVLRSAEHEAGRFCRERPASLAAAVSFSLLAFLVMFVEYALLLRFLGLELGLRESLAGLLAARIAYLLMLPAGLGVLEAGQAAVARTFGLSPAVGLSVSLIIRLRDVVFSTLGLWWGVKALSRAIPED